MLGAFVLKEARVCLECWGLDHLHVHQKLENVYDSQEQGARMGLSLSDASHGVAMTLH